MHQFTFRDMGKALLRSAAIIALLLYCAPAVRAALRLTEAEAKAAATVKQLPEYPVMARQMKVTGKVELDVDIDSTGQVKAVRIVSGRPMLARPCAKVVGAWRFKAFQEDGKSTEASAPLSFEFK